MSNNNFLSIFLLIIFSAFYLPIHGRVKKSPQENMMLAANYSHLFIPFAPIMPFGGEQIVPPQLGQQSVPQQQPQEGNVGAVGGDLPNSSSSLNFPILINQVPSLPFCRVGQRFVVNHILFVCHQYREHRRGFKPFACALKNQMDSKLLTRNGTLDDEYFRYKCLDTGDGSLRMQALNCILNEIEIKAGQSLRRGRSEYLCIKDSQGLFKMMEKQSLHEFCLPGNRNESLLDGEKCPGMTVGTIHASFGSGSEVIFDTKLMTIVPREKSARCEKKVSDNFCGPENNENGFGGKVAIGHRDQQQRGKKKNKQPAVNKEQQHNYNNNNGDATFDG